MYVVVLKSQAYSHRVKRKDMKVPRHETKDLFSVLYREERVKKALTDGKKPN